MFSVLVIRLRSLRLLRVSGIVMRLRMFLLLITFLKASHSFRNRLLVICKNAYLFATMIMTFFFQAEDGIRDELVTGVQTCALPILFLSLPPILNLWELGVQFDKNTKKPPLNHPGLFLWVSNLF